MAQKQKAKLSEASSCLIRSQHVDIGKLNKCILKASIDTVLCLTQ